MSNSRSINSLMFLVSTRTQIVFRRPMFGRKVAHQTPIIRNFSSDASAHSNLESKPNPSTKDSRISKDIKIEQDPQKQLGDRVLTMAEKDEELRMRLEGRSGDGGAAGLELENGKPVAMKRGVRDNMFRLI